VGEAIARYCGGRKVIPPFTDVIRIPTFTDGQILAALWAAKDGDQHAQRYVRERRRRGTKRERAVIRDFDAGKYKRGRGRPSGLMSRSMENNLWIDGMIAEAIEKARKKDVPNPVHRGMYNVAMRLKKHYKRLPVKKLIKQWKARRRRGRAVTR
jgi:hypothetical protein